MKKILSFKLFENNINQENLDAIKDCFSGVTDIFSLKGEVKIKTVAPFNSKSDNIMNDTLTMVHILFPYDHGNYSLGYVPAIIDDNLINEIENSINLIQSFDIPFRSGVVEYCNENGRAGNSQKGPGIDIKVFKNINEMFSKIRESGDKIRRVVFYFPNQM